MSMCPTCGSALPEGAVFCANCGSSIAPANEAPAYAAEQYIPVEEKPAKVKKPLNVKLIAIIALAVVVVGAVVAWLLIANPFADPTEPLKDYYSYYYAEELSLSAERGLVEGLGGDPLKKIYNIYAETKQFESVEESWENRIDGYKDSMGKDWEYSYKVANKYQCPELYAQSADFSLQNWGISLLEQVAEFDEMDEDEIENIADYLDIEVSDVESLISSFSKLADEMIKANVTDVYTVTYTASRSGKELDADEMDLEDLTSMTVYKINGKWVSETALSLVRNRVSNIIDSMNTGASIEAD